MKTLTCTQAEQTLLRAHAARLLTLIGDHRHPSGTQVYQWQVGHGLILTETYPRDPRRACSHQVAEGVLS